METPAWGTPPSRQRIRLLATATCVGAQAGCLAGLVMGLNIGGSRLPWAAAGTVFGLAGLVLSRGDGPEPETIRGE